MKTKVQISCVVTPQLCGYRTADQVLCFHYIDSIAFLLPKSQMSRLQLDMVVNPEDRFSREAAVIV